VITSIKIEVIHETCSDKLKASNLKKNNQSSKQAHNFMPPVYPNTATQRFLYCVPLLEK